MEQRGKRERHFHISPRINIALRQGEPKSRTRRRPATRSNALRREILMDASDLFELLLRNLSRNSPFYRRDTLRPRNLSIRRKKKRRSRRRSRQSPFEAECLMVIAGLKGGISRRLSSRRAVTSFVCAAPQTSRSRLPTKMTENQRDRPRQRGQKRKRKRGQPVESYLHGMYI